MADKLKNLLLAVLLVLAIMVPVNLYIRTDYDRWLKNIFYLKMK